jgi:hypothetical protein
MMFAKTRLFQGAIVLFTLFFLSCSTNDQKVAVLYNVDSLFNTQIDYLLGHQAVLNKKAVLNGIEKITTINPKDSLAWNQELAIFFELDVVNKPIYKGVYKIEEFADNKSNLSVKYFSTTEDLPARFLKVYYQKSLRQLRKIEARYDEANSLYSSRRFLTMEFENVYNKTILTSYSIAGGQKMFLDDSVQYNIDANIVLKK